MNERHRTYPSTLLETHLSFKHFDQGAALLHFKDRATVFRLRLCVFVCVTHTMYRYDSFVSVRSRRRRRRRVRPSRRQSAAPMSVRSGSTSTRSAGRPLPPPLPSPPLVASFVSITGSRPHGAAPADSTHSSRVGPNWPTRQSEVLSSPLT